jgi:hypothetical protein
MCCVLLCMLEAVESGLCLPEVLEVMRCVLQLVPEVMYSVLLCLKAVESFLSFTFEIFIVAVFSLQSTTGRSMLGYGCHSGKNTNIVHSLQVRLGHKRRAWSYGTKWSVLNAVRNQRKRERNAQKETVSELAINF